ncbi:MAG TPA: alpha/beta fold hydrolase [Polyangiaceae bacterium]
MRDRARTGILAVAVAAALAGCGAAPPAAAVTVAPPTPPPALEHPVEKPLIVGELVTYRGGSPLGHESYRDDGETLVSKIRFGPRKATITLSRAKRHVRVEAGGNTIENDLGPGTVALENGHWEAYAIAAEQFADATTPKPVKVLLPAQGLTLEGTITVTPAGAGGRKVEITLKALTVTVELDARGSVVRASVPSQGIEVRRAGEAPPVIAARAVPASVTSEPVEVMSGPVTLRGELWVPAGAKGKVPVVLIIAGSGPTDRDGNSALGLRTDAYRMLAEALAVRGIASLRYDKRGVGQSTFDFDPAKTVLDDFVADAGALAAKLRSDPRFSTLTLVGHSEGGPIALLLAQKTRPNALVLVASPGRPLEAVLREQLAAQLDAAAMGDFDRIIKAIRAGSSPEPVPEGLAPLFNPTVRAMIKSLLEVDPAALIKKLDVKTAVIQGEHDAQVTVADARALAAAQRHAKLTLLPTMNHVFKDEASAALPQASYDDPSKPLAAGFVDAVVAAVPLR